MPLRSPFATMLAAVVLLLVTGGVAAAGPAATPEQRAATAVEVALRQIGCRSCGAATGRRTATAASTAPG